MEIDTLYQKFKSCTSFTTDTRKLKQDCMYFALKGDNFDGNTFVDKAFINGAKYCVVDNAAAVINANCIYVENVLATLQDLATYHRKAIKIPIISLTGSNGKTTTKELINAVLKTTYNVNATVGNLNNHIGVPLTLLSFTSDLDFGIVEMGANHENEIAFLCTIAQPDFGLITNFGKAHLEGFGTIEGVIKAKSELYDYLRLHDKTAFINKDDDKQVKQIDTYKNTVTFGSSLSNDSTIMFKSANPNVTLLYNNITIDSQLIGDYNYSNIAIAIAIGQHFNVTSENIKKGIENYYPKNNRSEIIKKGSTEVILDAYNANPTSMLAALKNFKQIKAKNKYLFIGDMFELGVESEKEHQSVVDFIESNFEEHIYIIGNNFYNTTSKPTTHKFKSFEDFKPFLKSLQLEEATALIKGSRGMALERIMEYI